MTPEHRNLRRFTAIVLLAAACAPAWAQQTAAPAKVSRFGQYEGYSEARFDEWVTSSQYVTMRDGVKLAVDIVRPAVDGRPADEPLPVVWTHSRYHRNPRELMRAMGVPDDDADAVESLVDVSPDLAHLVRHGYVVAAAGVRGSGASFGRYEGLFSPAETRDAAEITQWLADQPWCDGNVGMFGGSYLGITQYMAASQAPPALKAIFPVVAAFDLYDVVYPGGVYRDDLIEHWGTLTRQMDTSWPAPRVDGDEDGRMMEAARAEHADNWDVLAGFRAARFRDSTAGDHAYTTHGPSPFLEQINDARVPAYHWNGWLDIFVTDAVLWYANYAGPQRLAIGPWPHGQTPDNAIMAERMRLRTVEQHRWFDRWLKGIDNGIMDEPPISYALVHEPDRWTWRTATQWPPRGTRSRRLYFTAGPSGSVASVNDGRLDERAPQATGARDTYRVDLTTTTGTSSRWDNAVGVGPMVYPDMAANDRKALTYTTAPLEADLVVVGHPIAIVHLSCAAADADVHVLLEEVGADGVSRYVTEGVLRASHRTESPAPWRNLGLPYQRSNESDRRPLSPGEPVELRLDLHPIANVFDAGHRLRVVIMGADADNTETLPGAAGTVIHVHRDAARPSSIVLPVLEPGE